MFLAITSTSNIRNLILWRENSGYRNIRMLSYIARANHENSSGKIEVLNIMTYYDLY